LQTGNAEVLERATPPSSPATPRLLFNSGLAAFLGLVLGLVAAAALELLDRRVKDEDDVSLITSLPSLASIPPPRRSVHSGPLEFGREQTEGYRSLATNLRFFKLGGEVKVLMITSPSPHDGKTSVTLSLAAALAEFGQKVIAVECDLRRPSFADYLQLSQASGLSSILAGMASWSQEVVDVDVGQRRASAPAARGESGHFSVLPAGPHPPNPHALLSSSEMHELLLELRAAADVVLIDTPALGTFTDAVPLVPRVDGVALVVRLEHTTRDTLTKACNVLAELDAPVLGTVLVGGAQPSMGRYYGSERSSAPAATSRRDESQNGQAGSHLPEGAPTSRT
jgi:capsular exopolysaccharide synthesis family protein